MAQATPAVPPDPPLQDEDALRLQSEEKKEPRRRAVDLLWPRAPEEALKPTWFSLRFDFALTIHDKGAGEGRSPTQPPQHC